MSTIDVEITGYEECSDTGGTYVQFVLKVNKDGIEWEIRKRFSEFSFFYTGVSEYAGDLGASFPPKQVGRMSATQLEKRREDLEIWFFDLL